VWAGRGAGLPDERRGLYAGSIRREDQKNQMNSRQNYDPL
jgi:hypothetical protein